MSSQHQWTVNKRLFNGRVYGHICLKCSAIAKEPHQDWECPGPIEDEPETFEAHTDLQNQCHRSAVYQTLLPKIREVARAAGYAIGVHGSMVRDFDLIAVPWSDSAVSGEELAYQIAVVSGGVIPKQFAFGNPENQNPGKKPHGRLAWTILLSEGENPLFIDLSVTPRDVKPSEKDRRVYYQDLVYEVCRLIDVANGNMPGKGIVCGTIEEPSTQLQQAVTVLIKKALRPAPTHAEFEKLEKRLEDEEAATELVIVDGDDSFLAPGSYAFRKPDWVEWGCFLVVPGEVRIADKGWQYLRLPGQINAPPLPSPEAIETTKPSCDTCGDTGQTMVMVCYGSMPFEQIGECPDCHPPKREGASKAITTTADAVNVGLQPQPSADTCPRCGRRFAGTFEVANRDQSTCWTKYAPNSPIARQHCREAAEAQR